MSNRKRKEILKIGAIGAAALSLLALPAAAHGPGDPPHQSHCLGDLKLESGEAIRDFCRLIQ